MKKIPFVGLHAHSVAGSIFDALGYPQYGRASVD